MPLNYISCSRLLNLVSLKQINLHLTSFLEISYHPTKLEMFHMTETFGATSVKLQMADTSTLLVMPQVAAP